MAVDLIVKFPEDKRNIDKDHSQVKETNNIDNAKTNTTDEVDFDDLITSAGEFGKYQILLFFSTFPFYVFGVFVYYTQLFLTEVSPNHWCWIPELENITELERRSLAIPQDASSRFGYSHCKAYAANWSEVIQYGLKPNESWSTVTCEHGWEFNKSEIPYPTISSELGWVCEKDSYQATAQTFFFVGSIVGGFVFGWVSDRFGRLPVAVTSNIVGCLGGVLSTFTRNLTEFAICRFVMGMAYDNCMMMAYLIALEYVAPKYRTIMSNMSFALFYAFTVTALPWLVLACGHWKIISLVTSVPLASAVLALYFLPESPRWLLTKGRIDETINKLLTIGRVNGKEIPTKLVEQFRLSASSNKMKEETASSLELLKRPTIRRIFICMCIEYMCCTMVFDGLVRSLGQLDFDFFVSFSVVSFTEFPSMLVTAFIMDWMGRRFLTAVVMAISCVFSILTVFVSGFTSVTFAVIARFCVNMAYSCAMQWAVEMLPTSVRGSGASVVHICGYVATALTPYVIYLETYVHWLPLVVVGAIAGLGAVIAFTLPETAKKDMPQTFEEAEEMVRTQKFWEFSCFKKNEVSKKGHINNSFEI